MDVTGDADVVDGTGERMCLRQEQEHAVALVMQQIGHIIRQVRGGGAVMGLRHLDALRRSRGARGVHDGTQIGLLHAANALVELLVGEGRAVGLQLIERPVLQAHDVLERRAVLLRQIRLLHHVLGFDHKELRVGIVDDVADLLGGIGVVDRGDHTADGEHRAIEDIPFIGGVAHERHPVALPEPLMHEALGHLTDVVQGLACSLGDPFIALLERVQTLVRHTFGTAFIDVVDAEVLR